MSKDNNKIKLCDQENNPDALSCLENDSPIRDEIFDIAKLLARIAVDEYFNEVKKSSTLTDDEK